MVKRIASAALLAAALVSAGYSSNSPSSPDAKYGDPGDITRHDHRVTDYVDRPAD